MEKGQSVAKTKMEQHLDQEQLEQVKMIIIISINVIVIIIANVIVIVIAIIAMRRRLDTKAALS